MLGPLEKVRYYPERLAKIQKISGKLLRNKTASIPVWLRFQSLQSVDIIGAGVIVLRK